MTRRFTATEKWDDGWYLSLNNDWRIIWQYILDRCTNAGRFKKNIRLLNFCCNTNITEDDLIKQLNGRVVDCGDFYFIPKFLKYQYPRGLNSNKPAILAVRKEILEYSLLDTVVESFGNDYLIIKDKDTDKDKEKDKDKDIPQNAHFDQIWAKYPKRVGRKAAQRHYLASVKTDKDRADIETALKNYLASERVSKNYIQNGSTWFNGWHDWVDFKEEVCPKCKNKGKYISTTGYEVVCKCPAVKRS